MSACVNWELIWWRQRLIGVAVVLTIAIPVVLWLQRRSRP